MSDFKVKKVIFFLKSVVRSEKSNSRALTQFRVILLDNLAVTLWCNQATLTVHYAVSNGTKRALNVAEIFSCAQRTLKGKLEIDSNFKNEN